MIARLTGQLIEKQPPTLVVEVNGIGYELEAPMSTFYKVTLGAAVTLYVHQVVREDANLLYGFASREERDMCRTLLKVNGVGPKMALAILSSMEADAFAACIRQGDIATLTRIPGVGKKTAERLIIEMRDRVGNGSASLNAIAGELVPVTPEHDAITALISLGYKAAEAERAVGRITLENASAEDLIRQALKGMVKA
ncbi:MAG: Holliday junction branch migration protein RuvA [Moraxellaceae bacterium]|nr:Holliday junction branch migration protein RuvA [Moraxellaceae bacterium]MCC6201276.1 Holliday junction branch migration protein RuvA [Moraxellaceae bacterium]HQV41651.1 Holliday junction branch migration protein RuvA [Moraxellaceae bacterium]